LMGRLYYGEFGIPEPVALLDAIGVSAGFAGQKVGRALLRQLAMNLNALNISTLRTEVDWEQGELMSFFRHAGFRPSTRICLDASVADIND
ncbi:MAG TPA: GNAT family N-acetyltransferase, partial [Dehalococcoidia bacterium]|nr:GNAT family N-acetyltransferase [Dehalococcoidia bacterium]